MRGTGVVSLATLLVSTTAAAAQFPCDEAGVLAAIAAGGGPHTFACAGPTTVVTSAELVVTHAVELDGGGLLTLSGGNTHRVLRVEGPPPFTATLRNLTLTQGVASGAMGGCVRAFTDVTLDNVVVQGCQSSFGGGIGVAGALATLDGCTVSGNLATGGAVGGLGGGISVTDDGEIVVTNSVIRDNTAQLGGGIGADAEFALTDSTIASNVALAGGGILVGAGGSGTIQRSTISDNRANSVGGGGGLASESASIVIAESTLARNRNGAITNAGAFAFPSIQVSGSTFAGNFGSMPAIHQVPGARVSLRNTVIAGRCGGIIESGGGNVESPGATCVSGPDDQNHVTSDALNLGKLGPHGGPTNTIPIRAPSVAIDNAVGCPPPATDQRGVTRPQGVACDSGAFEQDFAEQVPALPPAGVAVLALVLAASARYRRFGSSTP